MISMLTKYLKALSLLIMCIYSMSTVCKTFQEFMAENSFNNELDSKYYKIISGNLYLDLSHQKLTDIEGLSSISINGKSFSSLSRVNINLSNNKLSVIPADIMKMSNLYKLDLSHNHLVVLPDISSELIFLTDLNLSHNNLTALPCIDKLYSLKSLNLSNNKFEVFPEKLSNNLINLDVSNNCLKSIPYEIFFYTRVLRELNLSNNYITSFPVFKHEKLSMLQSLKNIASECAVAPYRSSPKHRELIDVNVNLSVNPLDNIPKRLYSKNCVDLQDTYLGLSILLDNINTESKKPSFSSFFKKINTNNKLKNKSDLLKLIFFNEFSDKSNLKSIMKFKNDEISALSDMTDSYNEEHEEDWNAVIVPEHIIKLIYSYLPKDDQKYTVYNTHASAKWYC